MIRPGVRLGVQSHPHDHVALDVGHTRGMLAEYRWKLAAMLGLGVGFAAIAGVIVTREGLRPVRRGVLERL